MPRERGKATRVELRLGDGSSNPYLATAAALFAGIDGIRRQLEPPEPFEGLIYEQPEAEELHAAAAHVRRRDRGARRRHRDQARRWARSWSTPSCTIKAPELDRCKKWVTDWEFREYTHHL